MTAAGPAAPPTVSIVTPCYNAARYVEETIRSVVEQSFESWELVIVDDGSTDGSAALAERTAGGDPRVRVLRQENGGVATARNAGLDAMSGASTYVGFLDADDRLLPGSLHALVDALIEHPDVAGAFGHVVKVDAEGRELGDRHGHPPIWKVAGARVAREERPERIGFEHVIPGNPILTPGQLLLRRSALGNRRFDQSVAPCEDWDMWLSVTRGQQLLLVDQPTLEYRQHSSSASADADRMRRQRQAVYRKQLAIAGADPVARSVVRTAYPFGMYGLDARLCRIWGREALARWRVLDAARYAARGLRCAIGQRRAARSFPAALEAVPEVGAA